MVGNDDSLDYFIEEVEVAILKNPGLKRQYSTGSRITDFYIGDIVTCTYLKGLYRVSEIFKDCVEIYPVEIISKIDKELVKIDPIFLKKAKLNPETVKILYNR